MSKRAASTRTTDGRGAKKAKTEPAKLCYFTGRGRAEPIRILCAVAGIPYQDVALGQWDAVNKPKPFVELKATGKLPFETVPLWEEPDGFALPQSGAIIRYLAAQYGLVPKDAHGIAMCDAMYEGVSDIYMECMQDCTKIPTWLGRFEKILEKNGTGYLVGKQLTYPDLSLWGTLEHIQDCDMLDLTHLPKLKAFKAMIEEIPEVKAHRESPQRAPVTWKAFTKKENAK